MISETLIDLYSKARLWLLEPAGAASIAALEVLRVYQREDYLLCDFWILNNDNRMQRWKEQALIYDGDLNANVMAYQRPGALREM